MKYLFLKTLFALCILAMFTKIYQHNCLIRMSYKKQRLQKQEQDFLKIKSDLLTRLYQETERTGVQEWAMAKRGMSAVSFSQVISVTGR